MTGFEPSSWNHRLDPPDTFDPLDDEPDEPTALDPEGELPELDLVDELAECDQAAVWAARFAEFDR